MSIRNAMLYLFLVGVSCNGAVVVAEEKVDAEKVVTDREVCRLVSKATNISGVNAGAKAGLVIGAIGGGLIGCVAQRPGPGDNVSIFGCMVLYGVLGGVLGMCIGKDIGDETERDIIKEYMTKNSKQKSSQ